MGTWKTLARVKDDNGEVKYTELKSHDCTKSELGLEDGGGNFYPPEELRDTKKILNAYADQLKCFD